MFWAIGILTTIKFTTFFPALFSQAFLIEFAQVATRKED